MGFSAAVTLDWATSEADVDSAAAFDPKFTGWTFPADSAVRVGRNPSLVTSIPSSSSSRDLVAFSVDVEEAPCDETGAGMGTMFPPEPSALPPPG